MNILKRKKIIVVVGSQSYQDLFKRLGNVVSKPHILFDKPHTVSLVVFSGGEDVHPYFYNSVDKHNLCSTNPKRDRFEQILLEQCKKFNIKMTGICRGLQFLNVMDGGFMFQHITNHAIDYMHEIYYPYSGEKVLVNSYHHQLIGLSSGSTQIAWAKPKRSHVYVWPKGQVTQYIEQEEVEAAIFPKINAMGVQYHPEMMDKRTYGRIHYERIIKDFIDMSITKFMDKYGRKADDSQRTSREN